MNLGMAILERNNACSKCNYTLMQAHIPLGKIYRVDLDSKAIATLICGGCGHHNQIEVILEVTTGKYLPTCVLNILVFQKGKHAQDT